ILNHLDEDFQGQQYFINRHRRPFPRITFSNKLNEIHRLALNDISDGIANETAEIAEASQVTIHLYDEYIPIHPFFNQFSLKHQRRWAYCGDEDLELVRNLRKIDWPIVETVAVQTVTKITDVSYVSINDDCIRQVTLHGKDGQQVR